jgi:hypothetical protein
MPQTSDKRPETSQSVCSATISESLKAKSRQEAFSKTLVRAIDFRFRMSGAVMPKKSVYEHILTHYR